MAGKKWCEYCRINLPYNKKAIQQHEATRLHIQNKAKHIKFQRIKIQREDKLKKQALKANSLMSTANIPKAKKGSNLDKQVEEYRNDVIMSGKMAIHQLIAEKTKGLYGAPIQYPEKEDLVLAENYIDENENEDSRSQGEKFEMWKIDICEETGKACFINRISQAKVYEPPKGYIMSQEQKEEWEQTKKICDEVPDNQGQQLGEIGEWEEVQQQDYFQQNRAQQDDQIEIVKEPQKQYNKALQLVIKKQEGQAAQKYQAPKIQEKQKSWMDELQQKIQKNELSESEVISTVLSNTIQECRSVKQKNEVLKKLVRNDFEIKATLDKNDAYWLAEQEKDPKKAIGIKPRKRNKVCQIVDDNDIV